MDWHKSKNILIVVLLLLDTFLAGLYLAGLREENEQRIRSAELTRSYFEDLGAAFECEIPVSNEPLSVLYVNIVKGTSPITYEGYSVIVQGSAGLEAHPERFGDTKGRTVTASQALHELLQNPGESAIDGMIVRSMKIVYCVDRSFASLSSGEDTALPMWQIETNKGTFYIDALE